MAKRYFLNLLLYYQICFIVFLLLVIFLNVVRDLGEILIDIQRSHVLFHLASDSLLPHFLRLLVLHENNVIQVLLDEVPVVLALFRHLGRIVVFFFARHHFERAIAVLITLSFVF